MGNSSSLFSRTIQKRLLSYLYKHYEFSFYHLSKSVKRDRKINQYFTNEDKDIIINEFYKKEGKISHWFYLGKSIISLFIYAIILSAIVLLLYLYCNLAPIFAITIMTIPLILIITIIVLLCENDEDSYISYLSLDTITYKAFSIISLHFIVHFIVMKLTYKVIAINPKSHFNQCIKQAESKIIERYNTPVIKKHSDESTEVKRLYEVSEDQYRYEKTDNYNPKHCVKEIQSIDDLFKRFKFNQKINKQLKIIHSIKRSEELLKKQERIQINRIKQMSQ